MGLTEQERRCVNLACAHLHGSHGGDWDISPGPSLDELNPSIPSPETLVGNGSISAAIEVKRLTGDSVWQAYHESIRSLERSLAPACGGYYYVLSPIDLRLPIDRRLFRQLRGEIARIAPSLSKDQSGILRIPRQGYLVHRDLPLPHARCLHTNGHTLLRPLTGNIPGSIFLIDHGLEHSFFTDGGKEEFLTILREAYRTGQLGASAPLVWHEEWKLTKTDDEKDAGVWIICATEARDVPSSIDECIQTMASKTVEKFEARRWADLHVAVFESASRLVSADRALPMFANLDPDDVPGIDLILLVDGDEIHQAYPPDRWLERGTNDPRA